MEIEKINNEIIQAAHALLITSDGNILLQHKDNNKNQLNPGKIGMFGGTIENGETEIEGFKRELNEELEMDLEKYQFHKLNSYLKTKELDGVDHEIHVYIIEGVEKDGLVLHEGKDIICDKAENFILNSKLSRITKLALEDYLKKI